MMKYLGSLLVLILVTACSSVPVDAEAALKKAQTETATKALPTEEEVQAFMTGVMGKVGSGGLDAAYSAIADYSLMPRSAVMAGLQASKERRDAQFMTRFGKTTGYDFVSQRKLGKTMMRFVFLEKTERQPLPWVFHWYKTDAGWVVSQFGWDAQASALYVTD